MPSPLFGHSVSPVTMEHAQIEVLLCREMPHTGHKRPPQRPIIGPFGKDFVDSRVMDGWFAMGICRHGQALPLHPRVEQPQDEVKDAIIAQFALRSPLRQREVRQDKCGELGSDSCTGIGVVAGFGAVVLIMQWPHLQCGNVR